MGTYLANYRPLALFLERQDPLRLFLVELHRLYNHLDQILLDTRLIGSEVAQQHILEVVGLNRVL